MLAISSAVVSLTLLARPSRPKVNMATGGA